MDAAKRPGGIAIDMAKTRGPDIGFVLREMPLKGTPIAPHHTFSRLIAVKPFSDLYPYIWEGLKAFPLNVF